MSLKKSSAPKGKSITPAQRKAMVEFIQANPGCNSGDFKSQHNELEKVRVWEELTDLLNSMPGAQKDWEKWQKSFADWKSEVKRRALALKKSRKGTGGGPPQGRALTDIEVICLNEFLTTLAVDGFEGVDDGLEEPQEDQEDVEVPNDEDVHFMFEDGNVNIEFMEVLEIPASENEIVGLSDSEGPPFSPPS